MPALTNRRIALHILQRRHGSAFSLDLPIFERIVVLSDPGHIRQLFRSGPEVADTANANLGRVLGPNSLFALSGDGDLLPVRGSSSGKRSTNPGRGQRIVLRTLLRDYVIRPSQTRDERWSSHGVAVAPFRGARVRVRPRETIPEDDTESE
jgi:hypothetical protein